MLGDMVQCYVDDLVVKSRQRVDQLEHLKVIFNKLRKHQLKMNPPKLHVQNHLRKIPRVFGSLKEN